jgi:pyruvate dehydrogenase complex dehydrogenase (E1) component
MFRRFDEIFASCGWRVVTLKYGKALEAAFAEPGGAALKAWLEACGNADYAALTYLGGGGLARAAAEGGAGGRAAPRRRATTRRSPR